MRKIEGRLREKFSSCLELGEELRSVGIVTSWRLSAMQVMGVIFAIAVVWVYLCCCFGVVWIPGGGVTGVLLWLIFVQNWWVGVTQRRVIFLQLSALSGKPVSGVCFSVPLAYVRLDQTRLIVSTEYDMPSRFRCRFGARWATGLSIDQFRSALQSGKEGVMNPTHK
jgi:hypothetical protein